MVKKQTKTQPRILRWIILALLLAVVMVTVKVVAEHIEKQRKVAATYERVRVEAIEARQKQTPLVDSLHQSRIDLLVEAGVARSEGSYTTKLDTCSLVSTAQGWITTDWYQACRLEYTSLVPINLTRAEVFQRLSSHEQVSYLFGDEKDGRYQKVCDELFQLKGSTIASYYDLRLGKEDKAGGCGVPGYDKGEADSVVSAYPESETHVIEAFRTDAVDLDTVYIGVFTHEEYYRGPSLGCRDAFLFCESPLEKPMSSF